MMESGHQYDVLEANGHTTTDGKATWKEDDPNLRCENEHGEILKNLHNVTRICRRDAVRSKTKTRIGKVVEFAGDSLAAEKVKVLWRDGSETMENTNEVEVIERRFFHGNCVAAASDPSGQIGIVVDVNINVDLFTHDGSDLIKDISSRDLRRIKDFSQGDYVVLGSWLGRAEHSSGNVTVELDDGSVHTVLKADLAQVTPLWRSDRGDFFPYYPGQRVNKRFSPLQGTVTEVTVESVHIDWITSAGYGPDSDKKQPFGQCPRNLKPLSCFGHTNWKLGDWCLLPRSQESSSTPLNKGSSNPDSHDSAEEATETGDESDAEVATTEKSTRNSKSMENGSEASLSKHGETSDYNASAERLCNSSIPASNEFAHETLHCKRIRELAPRKGKKVRKIDNFERALLIVSTNTKVDVAWQDGKIEPGLDSTSLILIKTPGDHEFVAEQYVVEKAADSDDAVETRRVGVVKSVNAKDQTACVRWLKRTNRAEEPREFDKEEVASVYGLEEHPDYNYRYGDKVVRLPPISLPAKMDSSVHSVENMPPRNTDELTHVKGMHHGREKTENTAAHDTSPEFSDLSWFGIITGLKYGDIEVTWADGMISKVGPQAICVWVNDESIAAGSGPSDDVARGESSEDSLESDDNAEDHEPAEDFEKNGDPCGGSSSEEHDVSEASELLEIVQNLCNSKLPESGAPPRDEFISTFRGFDIIRDPSDHHFLGAQGQNNVTRKWLKRVQQDWDILLNNLPEGIYVRAYEGRMDLLRAMIVGAQGTPYHDGLFFFDLQLPPDYPDVPPSVYYHSGGLRINPNLYEGGKVCLSLLNTWIGGENEAWNPSTSSILQVLVSFQGLILNSKPYFNEAGYDKQAGTAEGEKNSLAYNENAFLLNCKTMMYLMRKPPKDFKELVFEHFRERGRYILKACNAYNKGHLIGSLGKDASTVDTNTDANTVGFKLMLAQVTPRLVSALEGIGAVLI